MKTLRIRRTARLALATATLFGHVGCESASFQGADGKPRPHTQTQVVGNADGSGSASADGAVGSDAGTGPQDAAHAPSSIKKAGPVAKEGGAVVELAAANLVVAAGLNEAIPLAEIKDGRGVVSGDGAGKVDPAMSWTTSDAKVATVIGSDLVTVGDGTATLIGTSSSETVAMVAVCGASATGYGNDLLSPKHAADDVVIVQGSHFVMLNGNPSGILERGGGFNLAPGDASQVEYYDRFLARNGGGRVLACDFTGDKRQDVLVVQGSHLLVLAGTDERTLERKSGYNFDDPKYWDQYLAAGSEAQLGLGDYDGDGNCDLLVGQGSHLFTLLGQDDGSLTRGGGFNLGQGDETQVRYYDALLRARSADGGRVVSGDFNGDGTSDVLVVQGSHFILLQGKAGGTFVQGGGYNFDVDVAYWDDALRAGSTVRTLPGDFNGDGKTDLLILQAPHLALVLGNASGTMSRAAGGKIDANEDAFWAQFFQNPSAKTSVGDFNGDGRSDLAILQGSHVVLMLGNVDGTFKRGAGHNLDAANPSAVSYWDTVNLAVDGTRLVAGDFNGDGRSDLLLVQGSHLVLLVGSADGSLRRAGGHNLDADDARKVAYWDQMLAGSGPILAVFAGNFDESANRLQGLPALDPVILPPPPPPPAAPEMAAVIAAAAAPTPSAQDAAQAAAQPIYGGHDAHGWNLYGASQDELQAGGYDQGLGVRWRAPLTCASYRHAIHRYHCTHEGMGNVFDYDPVKLLLDCWYHDGPVFCTVPAEYAGTVPLQKCVEPQYGNRFYYAGAGDQCPDGFALQGSPGNVYPP